jgi:Rad3-related DNA helicase
MIVDECHNAESQLMSFIEFKISDRFFRKEGIIFPKKETPLEYAEFFLEINLENLIVQKIKEAVMDQDAKMEEEWKQTLLKYSIFITSSDSDNWVLEFEDSSGTLLGRKKTIQNAVTLKPIFVNEYAQQYMFSMAERVLMMSATILSPKLVAKSLGIDPDATFSFRLKNQFPVENRKIFYDPCGSLNMKNKAETFPKLVKKVDEIVETHEGQRGIIHTHNFEIARLLMNDCGPKIQNRFLFQEEWDNKNEMLDYHMKASDTIIVAPAMHEGLDLKGDVARFAIICKVPYPSMGDPQIKARMERQGAYYDWLTALKLIQSYGRTIRSEDDWSVTYIVDGGFERFYKRTRKLIPGWFSEALES